eukprot:gene2110-3057_t
MSAFAIYDLRKFAESMLSSNTFGHLTSAPESTMGKSDREVISMAAENLWPTRGEEEGTDSHYDTIDRFLINSRELPDIHAIGRGGDPSDSGTYLSCCASLETTCGGIVDPDGAAGMRDTLVKEVVERAVTGEIVALNSKTRYTFKRQVGKGTYGKVWAAFDRVTNTTVALKQVDTVFHSRTATRALLREMHIMRRCDHPNIMALKDVCITIERGVITTMDLVTDLMDCDLARYIQKFNPGQLTPQTIKGFMQQHLHNNNILHRDLKPASRWPATPSKSAPSGVSPSPHPSRPSALPPYRPPELLFGLEYYTSAVDMWSIGCILAEMILGEPIFRGKSAYHQLVEVVKVVEVPPQVALDTLLEENAQQFLRKVRGEYPRKTTLRAMTHHWGDELVDLLTSLLDFNHHK